MKRFAALAVAIALLCTLLCGCNNQPLSLYAKDCLQRACDDPLYLGSVYCMTNPSYAISPVIGQDLVDALRLDEWVLYEDEERVFDDRAMTTIFVTTDGDDQMTIKVGKKYGAIGRFEDTLLPIGNQLGSVPLEKETYYRLPQETDGELFSIVDALAEHYVNLANDGKNPLLE